MRKQHPMKKWHVVYTKARNEKKVAMELERYGIEAYCPLITEIQQWSDRKKKVERPLIPSYVFLHVTEQEREMAFAVAGVVRFLFWQGKPAVVRSIEIESLKQQLEQPYASITITPIAKGEKFTFTAGVFKGQLASVAEVRETSIKVILESLGVTVIIKR